MQIQIKSLMTGGVCVVAMGLLSACSSVTRGTPISHAVINANMTAADYEVLGTTEGKSTRLSVLCGIVQVIDGDKVAILGIKFFEDQYAYAEKGALERLRVHPEDRAYYKALAATPDADTVAGKAFVKTKSGIPLIYSSQEVTYQGKG